MGRDSGSPKLAPCFIILTAFLVFIACSVLFGFSHGVKSNMTEFDSMNTMAKQESTTHTAPGGQPPNHPNVFTLNKAMTGVMVLAFVGMLAAVGACIGAWKELRCLLCVYFFICLVFGIFLMLIVNFGAEFSDVVEPVMARQIDTFCNETSYRTFKTQLGCYNPAAPTNAPPSQNAVTTAPARLLVQNVQAPGTGPHECGEECASKVQLLKDIGGSNSMGACKFLSDMCTSWAFQELSENIASRPAEEQPSFIPNTEGYCLLTNNRRAYAYTNMVTIGVPQPMTYEECKSFCNDDITCTGFTHRIAASECLLITPVKPVTGQWQLSPGNYSSTPTTEELQEIVNSDGTPGASCYIKTLPTMLANMEAYVASMVWYSMLAAIFFFVTALVTCCYMFTLGTQKKGKKGPGNMCFKLFCPCCATEAEGRKGMGQYAGMHDSEDYSG